jgi:hypothetical protein
MNVKINQTRLTLSAPVNVDFSVLKAGQESSLCFYQTLFDEY